VYCLYCYSFPQLLPPGFGIYEDSINRQFLGNSSGNEYDDKDDEDEEEEEEDNSIKVLQPLCDLCV